MLPIVHSSYSQIKSFSSFIHPVQITQWMTDIHCLYIIHLIPANFVIKQIIVRRTSAGLMMLMMSRWHSLTHTHRYHPFGAISNLGKAARFHFGNCFRFSDDGKLQQIFIRGRRMHWWREISSVSWWPIKGNAIDRFRVNLSALLFPQSLRIFETDWYAIACKIFLFPGGMQF